MRLFTAWFTQNEWASVVYSAADFLNSAYGSPFVRVTGSNGFLTQVFTQVCMCHLSL